MKDKITSCFVDAKTLYLDCQAGISGDMTVAALLDLGVPFDYLQEELAKLLLPANSYKISASTAKRHNITALKFDVNPNEQTAHRHYADIDKMIAASSLAERAKTVARSVFRKLAEAESKVHGVALEEVHFHEVGAVDSIVDIVGAAICLDYLAVEKIYTSALPVGSGFVQSAHGLLPVPAPATLELLTGLPLHDSCGSGERVTPTGAAIVAALADCSAKPEMTILKTGYGAGSKDFNDCPNILRAMLCSAVSEQAAEDILVVESNIDDSTAEVLGYVMERLLEAGALDVFFTSIQMKKSRPAVKLSFICPKERLEVLSTLLFTETSAIGLRYYAVSRTVLERKFEKYRTTFGIVDFKLLYAKNGEFLRAKPEYQDCRRLSIEHKLPLQDLTRRVLEEFLQARGE